MRKRNEEPRIRGVWEKVLGSGVWWIRYRDNDGKLHREKVGRKSAAADLYHKRKEGLFIGLCELPPRRIDRSLQLSQCFDIGFVFRGLKRRIRGKDFEKIQFTLSKAPSSTRARLMTGSPVRSWRARNRHILCRN